MTNTRYTCGMYGGCFNPLHLGHVKCMLQAASQCDRLIIVICNRLSGDEIDIGIRYRWVYETIRHFPNVSIYVLDDPSKSKADYTQEQWYADAARIKEFAQEPITAIFFGDDYNPDNCMWTKCYPTAQAVVFPRDGISSTAIRQAPLSHWDWLPSNVRPHYVKKVLILGTESTGKSTLTINLARYFNTVYLEEVGRAISMRSGTDRWMLPGDFTDILLQHKTRQRQLLSQANRVFFEDTNCLTTEFYLEHLNSPERAGNTALAEAIAQLNSYDLVLMLKPTVAFVQDGDRHIEAPEERERCTTRLLALCERHGIKPTVIEESDYAQRFMTAVNLVKELLREK